MYICSLNNIPTNQQKLSRDRLYMVDEITVTIDWLLTGVLLLKSYVYTIVPCSTSIHMHDTLMFAIHTADLTTQSGSLQPYRVSFQVQQWWGVACTLRVLFHSWVLTHGACCSTPWRLHTVGVVLLVGLTHCACCLIRWC